MILAGILTPAFAQYMGNAGSQTGGTLEEALEKQRNKTIPSWIKNNADWWSRDLITDNDFVKALGFLIHEKIIEIDSELSSKTEQEIPSWIKNNAEWWADGKIDDDSFIQGVEFMAKNGIIGNDIPQQYDISSLMDMTKESDEHGLKITWKNTDSKIHTVTSGSPENELDNRFDSYLFSSGKTFSFYIQDVGSFNYFCMVHPWEYGTITVTEEDLMLYHNKLEAEKESKEKEELMNKEIQQITSKFYSSLDLTSLLEPTPKDIERAREYLGEENYEKLQSISNKINSNSISQTALLGYGASGLTVEEELFLVEAGQSWIDYLKILLNEKIKQIDSSYDTAVNELNELDISEEEKTKYLKAIDSQKLIFQTGTIQGMMTSFATYEEQLEKKKKELEIKQEIISGTSLDASNCGEGTVLKNGVCVVDKTKLQSNESEKGGGCLIATATYGSELAPQVQQLRELRDNSLLQTASGTSFMNIFNDFYYSFSPQIADWERESPAFKELVKVTITPMISSLSILNYVDMDSEVSVLGYGVSLILLNVGMYFVAPAVIIVGIRKRF